MTGVGIPCDRQVAKVSLSLSVRASINYEGDSHNAKLQASKEDFANQRLMSHWQL